MSASTSPAVPPEQDPLFRGYKPFQPEEHGLERGFRLTAFSELKG